MERLPIDERLDEIVASLRARPGLVVVADPGAGKTTRVPRALLDAGFAERGEIVILEPRRIAARLAARRVATELGDRVGERVGFQVRFDDVSSARTRVRFVTEGILTRRLATEPALPGVAVVILDEMHERHLHGDVALAALRALQRGPRPDLKVVAMSATLDAEPVAQFLDGEIVRVAGRRFDVAVEFAERESERKLSERVAHAVRRVLSGGDGDVLVFLPGAAEIRRAEEACRELASVVVLHGDLPAEEQERAIAPSATRKVILATNVAETSITIPGVTAVIDSGLARVARHSPWSGLPSLETGKVSRASAAQRAGRAGRLGPGRCVRLYTRSDHDARPEHEAPEVRRVDLAETVLMLRASGHDPARFGWFEAPPAAAIEAAERLLGRLGALDGDVVTPLGRRMLALPLHPRLARLVIEAAARGAGERGALLAALLGERDIRRTALHQALPSDVLDRVEAFEKREPGLDEGAVRAVERAWRQLRRGLKGLGSDDALRMAMLAGFPDRAARRRRNDELVFAGGGSGRIDHAAEWMVVADAGERAGGVVVRLASAIEPEWLIDLFPERVRERREVRFDAARERVEVVSGLDYDGLLLDESRRTDEVSEEVSRALGEAALAAGPERFVEDPEALGRWRARVAFAAAQGAEVAPPDEAAVRAALVALCGGRRSFAELREASLLEGVRAMIGPEGRAAVERLAPDRVALPGGRRVVVQYAEGQPPWIASRLQDFFGMRAGPSVGGGRVPLVLHLLAPNQRAVQVTQDLAGFWERHYPALRRQLMRRYPKHRWPEDPA